MDADPAPAKRAASTNVAPPPKQQKLVTTGKLLACETPPKHGTDEHTFYTQELYNASFFERLLNEGNLGGKFSEIKGGKESSHNGYVKKLAEFINQLEGSGGEEAKRAASDMKWGILMGTTDYYTKNDNARGDKIWKHLKHHAAERPLSDYSVGECTFIFEKIDQLKKQSKGCKRGEGHRLAGAAFPWPLGSKDSIYADVEEDMEGMEDEDEGESTRPAEAMKRIVDAPNLILAMYLRRGLQLRKEKKLATQRSELGTQEHGPHVYNMGSPSIGWVIINSSGRIIKATRLAVLVNAIMNGYFDDLKNEMRQYERRDGSIHNMGMDFMINRMEACHLQCFFSEVLGNGGGAQICEWWDHGAACDTDCNAMNRSCNGMQIVSILSEENKVVRYKLDTCKCRNHQGNPGNMPCQFASFTTIDPQNDYYEIYNRSDEQLLDSGGKERSLAAMQQERRLLAVDPNALEESPRMSTELMIGGKVAKVVAFDVETTHLLKKDGRRIIQIASAEMSKVDGERNAIVHSALVMPTGDFTISPNSYKTHSISKQQLYGAKSTKDSLMELFACWEKIKGNSEHLVLVGHNLLGFDLQLLLEEMGRCGMDTEPLSRIVTHTIDTYPLLEGKTYWGEGDKRPENSKLGVVYKFLFKEEMANAHTALGDVIGLAKVLLRLDGNLDRATVDELELEGGGGGSSGKETVEIE